MRFSLALLVALAVAVIGGVYAAHTQNGTTAVSAPIVQPTPVPVPDINHIAIFSHPGGGPVAQFTPQTLTLHVGEEVTWENRDTQDHTATSDAGAFSTDVLGPGQTYRWTADKAGTYRYTCFIHPDMTGTVVVQP